MDAPLAARNYQPDATCESGPHPLVQRRNRVARLAACVYVRCSASGESAMSVQTLNATAARPAISLRDWSLLVLLGLLWGGSFFFVSVAVTEIPPLALVLLRVAIAAAALHIYILARRISFAPALAYAGSFVLLALLNNIVPFSLMFAGQTAIGAGLASVLNATTPVWTLIFAAALTRDEAFTWNKLAGIVLGITGTTVMIGPGLLAGSGGPLWAKLALLGTAMSYGLAAIVAKRFRALPPVLVAAGQLTASTVMMLPVVLALYGFGGLFFAGLAVWAAVLGLALLSTAFAYILFFALIRSAGSTNASLVTLLVPPSAILLGAVFLGERMESFEFAGMALIGLGLVVLDGRLFAGALKQL
jgi:drug/metabolite transporter (DMT)-like permease